MEVKLAAYRKKKRKEAMVNKIKEVLSWERNNMSNTDVRLLFFFFFFNNMKQLIIFLITYRIKMI